jgi:hypothetical protein
MKEIILVSIIIGIICLAGCRQTAPSIIGKWTCTSFRIVTDSNSIPIVDSTFIPNFSGDTLVFYANGKYTFGNPIPLYGTYILVGNTIVESYINNNVPSTDIDTIISLTSHSLFLAGPVRTSFIAINDTNNALWKQQNFYSYSR